MASNNHSKERPLLVNDQIKAPTMLVLDEDGGTIGTMSRRDAQQLALEQEKDIIQIHYNFEEKVATVKLVDLGQYLYDLKKKQKEQKKTQKKWLKQIKFGYAIGDNDLQMKVDQAQGFLQEGYSVKINVRLRGREKIYADRVYDRLLAVQEHLSERGRPQYAKHKEETHGYSIILAPK